MKPFNTLAASAVALAVAGSALAAPLKVRSEGTKSQTVIMCADCSQKAACAQAGDYLIALTVNLDNPKLGTGQLTAHVRESTREPVTDARVSVSLSMPDHKQVGDPVYLKHVEHGRYTIPTQRLKMSGRYQADVTVMLPGGDTVRQVFSFSR